MKTIVSFGDSFIFGSELKNNSDGSQAWPGLAAKKLGVNYKTLADPGCGNEAISMQIYRYFATHSSNDTLAVINWTWTQRWDFYVVNHEKWITIGPTCVPEKLEKTLNNINQSQRLVDFAQDYCINSLLWNKFRSLQTIANVQQYMHQKNIKFVQTYTDRHLFDTKAHAPNYIQELQNMVIKNMSNWNGKTFLEWCDERNFDKTETLHPLEEAHQAASTFWLDTYNKILK